MNKRLPELDGLRGFAALTVVASHYLGESTGGFPLFDIGWLGVNVFFVLSGFLIGGIILDQSERAGFFASFYFRRIARIFPIYFAVFLTVIFLARITAGHTWSDHPFSPTIYATFTVNFAESFQGLGSVWLRPMWTLSVEEQFYLLLPVLIVATPRRILFPLLVSLWLAALVCRGAFLSSNATAAWDLLPCRMDLLLSGVMVALAWRKYDLSRYLLGFRLGWAACIVAMNILAVWGGRNPVLLFMGSLTSVGISAFLLSLLYAAPEGRWVRALWLRWFGQISYCLYLVHQPVNGLLHGLLLNETASINSPASVAVTVLAFAVSIAIAQLSWVLFEGPILRWAAAKNARFFSPAVMPAT
ncbi:MAG TPA: acyltransferase [Rhizomicrobium sp.]